MSVCGPVLSFRLGWLLATTTRPRRAAGPPSTAIPACGSAGGTDPGRVTGVTVELCVLLWARPGAVQALISYEDTVLALLGEHGGRLLQRARTDGTDGAPTEVQLIEFASPDGYQAYLADERRTALVAERDAAIARTELYPVRLVRSS